MVRALLLALAVLLLSVDTLAAPAARAEKSVRVLDYSTPEWDGLVQGMVDEFNAMMRPRGWSIAACRSAPARI